MKKIIYALIIIGAGVSFTACTDTSLAEAQENERIRTYAEDSTGSVPINPPPDPPAGGN